MKKLKRDKILKIRLSRNELAIIKNRAQKCGMTNAKFAREAILKRNINAKKIRSQDEKSALRKLTGMDNNLNQMAKKVNTGKYIHEDIHQTIKEIRAVINQII